ncbi:hypothetical protein [Desulfonema ishimotonii]|uniref:hypothetical protein n=1 Tax=Desulfonema ishimotonii TaxID=45657 RepID=UPI000F56D4F2|nr:hypothetical protein [Desulfonema ishimotonii]
MAETVEREDIIRIVEGLKLIEEGVEKIQSVMRKKKIRSIKEMAAELIPVFKEDDDSLTESVIRHLG